MQYVDVIQLILLAVIGSYVYDGVRILKKLNTNTERVIELLDQK